MMKPSDETTKHADIDPQNMLEPEDQTLGMSPYCELPS